MNMATTQDLPHNMAAVSDERKIHVGLKAVLNIARLWQLSDDELGKLLGNVSRATIGRWRRAVDGGKGALPKADPDLKMRLSYLVGIYKALQLLHDDPHQANDWVRQPHTLGAFAGRTPLALMCHGDMQDLDYVRRYLDAERSR